MVMAAESQFHILAVDDCRLDRMLIEKLLRKTSYQVTTVDSGSKALEFLGLLEDEQRNSSPPSVSSDFHQELEVNLIITDYCMPGMSGYDLLKKIKESSSLKDIPVVIMSSENVPSRITRCLEEGAEEFFLKPVKLSDVKKLKPHSRRGKSRDQQEHQPEQEQELKVEVHKPQEEEEKSKPKEQPEEEKSELEEQSEEDKKSNLEEQPEEEEEVIVELEPNEINNKRKGMEEGISQERTRPRWQDTLV